MKQKNQFSCDLQEPLQQGKQAHLHPHHKNDDHLKNIMVPQLNHLLISNRS